MSFFQKCVCQALMGSGLADPPPCGDSNLGRMTGWEVMHNVFTIPDQWVSQNIPWKLELILWNYEIRIHRVAFPRVGLLGGAQQAVRRAWKG